METRKDQKGEMERAKKEKTCKQKQQYMNTKQKSIMEGSNNNTRKERRK